jgi:hypothetical protein
MIPGYQNKLNQEVWTPEPLRETMIPGDQCVTKTAWTPGDLANKVDPNTEDLSLNVIIDNIHQISPMSDEILTDGRRNVVSMKSGIHTSGGAVQLNTITIGSRAGVITDRVAVVQEIHTLAMACWTEEMIATIIGLRRKEERPNLKGTIPTDHASVKRIATVPRTINMGDQMSSMDFDRRTIATDVMLAAREVITAPQMVMITP